MTDAQEADSTTAQVRAVAVVAAKDERGERVVTEADAVMSDVEEPAADEGAEGRVEDEQVVGFAYNNHCTQDD